MLHYLAIASLGAYLISTFIFIFSIFKTKANLNKLARIFLLVAFLLQTVLIFPILIYDAAVLKGSGGYLFWFAWSISLIYFIAGKHANFPLVGAFVSPLGAFFLSASAYLSHMPRFENTDSYVIVMMHVIPAFISELCLMLALVVSSVYLVQSKRIKKKLSSAITTPAPSLVILEKSNQFCLIIGFLAMTLAILSGVFWQASNSNKIFSGDPFQWLALVVWLVTAFLLHARINLNYSAHRVSKLTIYLALIVLAGTVTLIFSQGSGVHNYAS
jgi:ABC-type transport system involved in cytochrome c biogenesis permease subunit